MQVGLAVGGQGFVNGIRLHALCRKYGAVALYWEGTIPP